MNEILNYIDNTDSILVILLISLSAVFINYLLIRLIMKFTIKKASTKEFYFNLLAKNGEIIATSEMYQTKAMCKKGIRSVKRNALFADVDDLCKN